MTLGLEGLSAAERSMVERLVERLRVGGFEMLLLKERLFALLADAAELAGEKLEARTWRRQRELLLQGAARSAAAANAPPTKE